jgi:hypothetical protein
MESMTAVQEKEQTSFALPEIVGLFLCCHPGMAEFIGHVRL